MASLRNTLLILTSIARAITYDEDAALQSLYYAYGSYCDMSELTAWDCKWCAHDANFDISSDGAGVVNVDGLQAFIGYDSDKAQVVLAFRGSDNAQDWLDNLDFVQMAYPNFDAGYVHEGFYNAWVSLQEGGLNSGIASMFVAHPGAALLVTGHSLGGALAQIAAVEMKNNSVYTALDIGAVNVITFGSPRWANDVLAAYYARVVDSNWRVVNQHDIVPTVPMESMGYHHTPTEIHYTDAAARTYTQCDGTGEDWDCWSMFDTSVIDHLNYFDMYLSCEVDGTDDMNTTDIAEWTSTTKHGSGHSDPVVVYKFKEGLGYVSKIMLSIGLAVGWLVAALFMCCYCRLRKQLKVSQRMNTYHAFHDEI